MMLAWYYSHQTLPIQFKHVAFGGLIIFLPALLIAKQPDLGTALMLVFSGCIVVFFAGISYRLIGIFSAICLFVAPLLWHKMHDYQKLRVLNFLDPERDPLGSGYHIIQSKIAIGSGGIYGKGFLNGSQSHLHFLPEHATDFIFAVLGEELGLIGTLLLLFLFFLIIYRCLYIAYLSEDLFSKLLVVSLTMNFFLSAFVNMGMVAGILPVVGIPLPLISYGGSSMLVLFASFGGIMSVNATKNIT
jgi:rod shape determining protein RodA